MWARTANTSTLRSAKKSKSNTELSRLETWVPWARFGILAEEPSWPQPPDMIESLEGPRWSWARDHMENVDQV